MNIAILLSVNSLILLLFFSINSLFLGNSYANLTQVSSNIDLHLASTNDTFTESESRIPSSAEDDEETSITLDNETSQEAKTLQSQAPYIENVIKTKFENKSSYSTTNTTTSSNVSQFYIFRNNYLSEWERIPFQSNFDTLINENSTQGYGIFTERNSNIFNTSQRVSLYIEPIGFKHEPIIDTKGNKLYLTNITTIITMSDDQGNEVPSIEDIQNYTFKSHNKITELYLPIDLDLTSRLPPGNYVINYNLIDEISKEDFDIQTNITIS
jgi:hypothetical protein